MATRTRTKTKNSASNSSKSVLLLILILATALSYLFFYGPTPIAASDNYRYGMYAYSFSKEGFHGLNSSDNFSTRYMVIIGIALSYLALGYSVFSTTIFGVLAFLATVLIVYKIGCLLLNKKAGLISAFMYSIMPLAVVNSSNVGNDVPMALFASLAIMFLLMAFNEHDRRRTWLYYSASGFFCVSGVLISPEALMISVPILLLLLVKILSKKLNRESLGIIPGVAAAILLIGLLGVMQTGNPLYVLKSTNYCYTSSSCAPAVSPGLGTLMYYINRLFPYLGHIPAPSPGSDQFYYFGYLAYLAVLGGIYLAIKKERALLIPFVWLAASLLYLSFGTTSIHGYITSFPYPRYMLVFAPAVALILGLFLAKLPSYRFKVGRSRLTFPFALPIVVLLFLSSLYCIAFFQYSQYKWVSPLMQTSAYVKNLPAGAVIYVESGLPYDIYLNYMENAGNRTTHYTYAAPGSCGSFQPGSYAVMDQNSTLAGTCGMEVAYAPHIPQWLIKYNLFDNSSGFQYSDLVVYKKD